MTKPDWCPPDVWQRAYAISEAAKVECASKGLFIGTGNALDVYDHLIARALIEAERRGMERAAEIATERLCPDTAKAIRRAATKENEP